MPKGIEDVKQFIKIIISPVEFKEIEIKNDEIIITAGSSNKAALIGRNRRRLNEMQQIMNNFFKKDVRIV